MKIPELLAPAGNMEKLKIALLYGADAVFLGGKAFSLRARASNFSLKDIEEAVNFAHSLNKKVYVTVNVFPHSDDLEGLTTYLKRLEAINVDAIIAASPAVIHRARTHTNLEIHISTQQSITNAKAINFWAERDIKRIVMAREVSLKELESITRDVSIDLEVFIHGGMCVSYSGKCTLSNTMADRDANRGGCAHSCRWNYDLFADDTKQNTSMPFSMASKDLQSVKYISKLIDLGIDSLKVEGRMKSIHYIATVMNTYRQLIDEITGNDKVDLPKYLLEIKKAENRLTSKGFMEGMSDVDAQLYNLRSEQPTQEFVGIIRDVDPRTNTITLEQRNYFEAGDLLEVFSPNFEPTTFMVENMKDADTNEPLAVARHPKQRIQMPLPLPVSKYDMVRKTRQS